MNLKNILKNIESAGDYTKDNDSVKFAAVVSGSYNDMEVWRRRFDKANHAIFNSDGSTTVISLIEKIGHKTREGNFLGTVLAYNNIRKALEGKSPDFHDHVILMGMIFGRGERLSPITQAKGCRKPAVEVTPSGAGMPADGNAFTSLEQALFYFVPVARYIEKLGFRGILNKWGDETQVPSRDLSPDNREKDIYGDCDIIKMSADIAITDDNAVHKEWLVYDAENNLIAELHRDTKEKLVKKFRKFGVHAGKSGEFHTGVCLGPVAVSYRFLDAAREVFAEEIERDGVFVDFDPYFFMALTSSENDRGLWDEEMLTRSQLKALLEKVPDFFEKVQRLKTLFTEKFNRPLSIKTLDLGAGSYWADIGGHRVMREKFLSLADDGPAGIISRRIARIPDERDANGNIIVNSELSRDLEITDSVIINSVISGKGRVDRSVIIDSKLAALRSVSSFVVNSYRIGKTVLEKDCGLFESVGSNDIHIREKMRHVTVLTDEDKYDMKVSEDTDLRDREKNYTQPVFGNELSFSEIYDKMHGASAACLEKRREKMIEKIDTIKEKYAVFKPLRFGTSGLRDKVENMTDMECYINTRGFIGFLKETDTEGLAHGRKIAVGGDLRKSTPRIISAVVKAIEDEGLEAELCGFVPSPVLAYYALSRKIPSIMVTGSHIPDDRNGIKFTKSTGEVLKSDEAAILDNVSGAREKVYLSNESEPLFNNCGMFIEKRSMPEARKEKDAVSAYIERYVGVFTGKPLDGRKVVLYQHSAVGRDILKKILEELGAEVIACERSKKFVPVDTEKISAETRTLLKEFAEKYGPFAIVSTDGDSDRPLVADETGEFIPGDKLGALVSMFLGPDFAAIPVSANDAVVKGLKAAHIEVKQTRIGSPYVIAAMNAKRFGDPGLKVVSWESNGGFLLGSRWDINGKTLEPLPTRDAVLPILSALLLAIRERMPISDMVDKKLPHRFTNADVIDDKTPGCEKYTAEMGKNIVSVFSPNKKDIIQADYNGSVEVYYDSGNKEEAVGDLKKTLLGIREKLSRFFSPQRGFSEIVSINFLDGIRIIFSNDDVTHLRPSGNAPEFRIYATSDTEERASEIVEKRKEILPEIIKQL